LHLFVRLAAVWVVFMLALLLEVTVALVVAAVKQEPLEP
jgi:hypothetical protein